MHDGVAAGHHGVHLDGVGQIGQHDLFPRQRLAKGRLVRQPQHSAVRLEPLAQGRAQAARGPGEQQSVVGFHRGFHGDREFFEKGLDT